LEEFKPLALKGLNLFEFRDVERCRCLEAVVWSQEIVIGDKKRS